MMFKFTLCFVAKFSISGDIQKKAVSLGAINLLVTLLQRNSSEIGLCGTAMMCIGNLAEPGQ